MRTDYLFLCERGNLRYALPAEANRCHPLFAVAIIAPSDKAAMDCAAAFDMELLFPRDCTWNNEYVRAVHYDDLKAMRKNAKRVHRPGKDAPQVVFGALDQRHSLVFAMRHYAGLTQKTLGELAGVDPHRISQWENAARQPKPERMAELAALCGYEVCYMCEPIRQEGGYDE